MRPAGVGVCVLTLFVGFSVCLKWGACFNPFLHSSGKSDQPPPRLSLQPLSPSIPPSCPHPSFTPFLRVIHPRSLAFLACSIQQSIHPAVPYHMDPASSGPAPFSHVFFLLYIVIPQTSPPLVLLLAQIECLKLKYTEGQRRLWAGGRRGDVDVDAACLWF